MLGSFEGASRFGKSYCCGWSQQGISLGQCTNRGVGKSVQTSRSPHQYLLALAPQRLHPRSLLPADIRRYVCLGSRRQAHVMYARCDADVPALIDVRHVHLH